MKAYTLPDFIEQLLIPDLEKMAQHQLHYYAFSAICQGIEIMGAAIDGNALEDFSLSEQRFTNSLATFFKDIRYKNNQGKFFSVLRGPLIHQLRPGDGFYLASEVKDNIKAECHLTTQKSGATLLIIEPFIRDFKQAFVRFKHYLLKSHPPSPERFTTTFIHVSPLPNDLGKTSWNNELSRSITLTPYATGAAVLPKEFPGSSLD